MLLVVAVALFVIVLTAYFSLLEASVLGIDDIRLATILRKQPEQKGSLQIIFNHKQEHLSALVLLSTLVSIAGSSFIGVLSVRVFDSTGLVVFTVLLTYGMLVFAKMLPKVLAVQAAEQVVVSRARFIRFLRELVRPVLGLALVWLKIFPVKKGQAHSRDDLHSIIQHYSQRGVIRQDERKLAQRVLVAQQKTLADLLLDHGSMISLDADSSIGALEDTLRYHPQKRYLVKDGEKTIGVVLYRHLARDFVQGRAEIQVRELVRQPLHLSPNTTLYEAMKKFKETEESVALLSPQAQGTSNPQNSSNAHRCVQMVTVKQVYQALLQVS